MSDDEQPYVGEIRLVGFNFAPSGWMFCEGQLLAISEYETLFNLIGTTYGGDGVDTFALPDLRGRTPVHQGLGLSSYQLAETGGAEQVTLNVNQIPSHSHAPQAGTAGTSSATSGNMLADSGADAFAPSGTTKTNMAANALNQNGGSRPHDNMPPYLAANFIISLFGVYPSPN